MSENENVTLETMLGFDYFVAQGRQYISSPIKLKHIPEFKEDKLFIVSPAMNLPDGYGQFFGVSNEESRKVLDKWLQRQLKFDNQPDTLEMVTEHDWDLDDIGRFIKNMVRMSG